MERDEKRKAMGQAIRLAEARLCGADTYERGEGRKDTRAGSYERSLDTEAIWGTRVGPGTVSKLDKKIHARIDEWRHRKIEGAHPSCFSRRDRTGSYGIVMKRNRAAHTAHTEIHERDPAVRGPNPRSRRPVKTESAKDIRHYRSMTHG